MVLWLINWKWGAHLTFLARLESEDAKGSCHRQATSATSATSAMHPSERAMSEEPSPPLSHHPQRQQDRCTWPGARHGFVRLPATLDWYTLCNYVGLMFINVYYMFIICLLYVYSHFPPFNSPFGHLFNDLTWNFREMSDPLDPPHRAALEVLSASHGPQLKKWD